MNSSILKVEDLKTHFFTRTGVVKAVDGISFEIKEGETLGLVGESGSGKSMTAWSILGLVPKPAGRIVGGRILFKGENLLDKDESEMREIRGKGICMVMQDPLTSLNPVFSVGNQILESLKMDSNDSKESLRKRAVALLASVRIPAPETRLSAYPHEMSGGMRQRVVGAIAISRSPSMSASKSSPGSRVIICRNASKVFSASATLLPLTLSVIMEADALEMAQPTPSKPTFVITSSSTIR